MKSLRVSALIAVLLLAGTTPVRAHGAGISDASALSALPIALSVAAPSVLLSGGAMLTVVAVQATAAGTEWLLERSSDGARFSVTLAAGAVSGLSIVTGTAVAVSAVGTGWVLSAAGKAIAFVPNQIGAALLYNERVTR